MDNRVHIVRMNSHLQLRTSLFTQTGYPQLIFYRGLLVSRSGRSAYATDAAFFHGLRCVRCGPLRSLRETIPGSRHKV